MTASRSTQASKAQGPITPPAPDAPAVEQEDAAAPVLTLDTPVEITVGTGEHGSDTPTPADLPVLVEESTDTTLTHVVLRPFVGTGTVRAIGEVVDASTWRMAEALVDGRRLRVLERKDPEPVSDGQGRFFIDESALMAFIEADVAADDEPDYSNEEN
jgi:hypothetical protein